MVVNSHGGATAHHFADAIRMAADLARSDFSAEVERNMTRLTAAVGDHGLPADEEPT